MSHATRQYPNIYLHQPSGRLTQPNRGESMAAVRPRGSATDVLYSTPPNSGYYFQRTAQISSWASRSRYSLERRCSRNARSPVDPFVLGHKIRCRIYRFYLGDQPTAACARAPRYVPQFWTAWKRLRCALNVALGPVGGEFEEVDRHVPMSMPKTPRIPYRELSPERLSPLPSPLSLMNFQVPSSSTAWLSSSQQVPYTSRLHHVLCIGSRLEGVSILTDDLFKHVPNEVLHTLATTPTACEVQIVLREGWGMGTVKNSRGVTVADVIRGLNDYLKSPLPWNSVVTRDIERAVGWREGVTGSHQDVVRGVDLLERRVRFGGLADYGEQHGWVLGLISFAPANA